MLSELYVAGEVLVSQRKISEILKNVKLILFGAKI